jgi:hypothetical protein
MGTRSNIIVQHQDGTWKRVYVHWDGYISGVGAILFEHYNSQERAEAVVAPGDMSSLYENCDKPEGHSYDTKVPGYTVYYGRDRGETDVDGTIGDSLSAVWPDDDTGAEFIYVYMKNPRTGQSEWFVGDADEDSETLVRLEDALSGKTEEPKPNVKAFGGNFVIGTRKTKNNA